MDISKSSAGLSRRTLLATTGAGIVTACAAPMSQGGGGSPVVSTTKGSVRGESLGSVNRFLGIPYAQSISGSNRFAPPQPVEPWSGVRDALLLPQSSPQQPEREGGGTPVSAAFAPPDYVVPGDDCLALNVWAPANADGSLPVMVWLHGGGWVSGSGSCPVYDGARLAGRGDVVVVTINHRLGASGFSDFSQILGGEFADSSNLSIRDMIAALEWVRDNIAGFGGNPDLVTIFGESGGGWKVGTLLGVPSAKGLFHRAVIQSGPLTRFMTRDEAAEVAGLVLDALGITPETADRLHSVTAEQMIAAEAQAMTNFPMSFNSPGFPTGFWPVIDGEIIQGHVFDPQAAASSLDVPLMVGQNGTEFTLFMLQDRAAYSLDEAGLEQRVTRTFSEADAPAILSAYRGNFPGFSPSKLWFRIFSDYAMGTLSKEILDMRAVPGAAPVYGFRFEWDTPIMDGILHSPHTIEIPFVFDNVNEESGIAMTGGGADVGRLGAIVSSAWVEFAKTGRPAASNMPDWPVYSRDGLESMHIDQVSSVGPYMDGEMARMFRTKLWQAAGLG